MNKPPNPSSHNDRNANLVVTFPQLHAKPSRAEELLDVASLAREESHESATILTLVRDEEKARNNKQSETVGEKPTVVSCRMCGYNPESSDDADAMTKLRRAHYKSDWHLLNLRRELKGKRALNEAEAESYFSSTRPRETHDADSISSISHSSLESSDEDEEDLSTNEINDDDLAKRLADRPFLSVQSPYKGEDGKTPHRALLYSEVAESVADVRALLASRFNPRWCVMLLRAGHFAAVMMDVGTGVVREHRTEHRYVVRQKQGGAQSSHDSKGHKANSVGAQIRRYGEQQMEQTILETLRAWDLGSCDRIFLSVPQKYRPIFVDASGSTRGGTERGKDGRLSRHDPRIRRVPFEIARPTLNEAKRVLARLACLTLMPASDVGMSREERAKLEAATAEKTKEEARRVAAERRTREEELASARAAADARVSALQTGKDLASGFYTRPAHVAAREGNVPGIVRALGPAIFNLGSEDEDEELQQPLASLIPDPTERALLPVNARDEHGNTPLASACAAGKAECLRPLIERGGDPSLANFAGQVPYQLAQDKRVRDELREIRGALESSGYYLDSGEWERLARIPPPPTEDEAERRRRKKKEAEKRRKEAERARKAQQATEAAAAEAERVRLALEAEARTRCARCTKPLPAKSADVFSFNNAKYCSSDCCRRARADLMSGAVERRLGGGGGGGA